MRRQMVAKVPHGQGYWLESMVLFIEVIDWMGECGDERFCISRYFPGCPGFSMMLKGEVWKAPNRNSTSSHETGPK